MLMSSFADRKTNENRLLLSKSSTGACWSNDHKGPQYIYRLVSLSQPECFMATRRARSVRVAISPEIGLSVPILDITQRRTRHVFRIQTALKGDEASRSVATRRILLLY